MREKGSFSVFQKDLFMFFSEVSEGKRRLEGPFFTFLKKIYSNGFTKSFLFLNLHIFPAGYRFSTFGF
jgi:hypothetical protein